MAPKKANDGKAKQKKNGKEKQSQREQKNTKRKQDELEPAPMEPVRKVTATMQKWATARLERVRSSKLRHVDKDLLANLRNSRGHSPEEVLLHELYSCHDSGKNLSTDFWKAFYSDFPLLGFAADNLIKPELKQPVTKELMLAMEAAHHENFPSRNIHQLITFLEHAGPLNEWEMYGLLKATKPGPTLTEKNSLKMLVSVSKHFAKHGGKNSHSQAFEVMQREFARAWRLHWEYMSATGISRRAFIQSNRKALNMFIDPAAFEKVFMATEKNEEPGDDELEIVLQSDVGEALFASEEKKLSFSKYETAVGKRIEDLVHCDFADDAVQGFQHVMMVEVQRLMDDPEKFNFDWTRCEASFCLATLLWQIRHLNDHWRKRWVCRMKELAICSGAVPRLPWEVLLWGDGPIDGISVSVKVPPHLLESNINTRMEALNILKNHANMDLSKMKERMLSHRNALTDLEPDFDVELKFLFDCVPMLLKKKIHDQVLKRIADGVGKHEGPPKTIEAITTIRCARPCQADPELAREIQGIEEMLTEIWNGKAPSDAQITSFSVFSRMVLKAIENWATYTVAVSIPGKAKSSKNSKMLCARPAVQAAFADFERDVKGGASLTPDHAKMFRQFSWLCTGTQLSLVDKFMAKCVKEHKHAFLGPKKALKDGNVEQDGPAASSRPGSAASSSTSDATRVMPNSVDFPATGNGSMTKADVATRANVMKFFDDA